MKKLRLYSLTLAAGIVMFTTSCNDDEGTPLQSSSFTVTVENAFEARDYFQTGVFNTPTNSSEAGPAMPGSSYEFSFNAGPGHYLSFATMFVQSNDLFYGPRDGGILLYENGEPISGDITSEIMLWDAGTEVNEAPYEGENQAPRQSGANTGDEENGTVELIENVNDGFAYPSNESVVRVTITPGENNMFTVEIENISDGDEATPFAPGVFVVHPSGKPLFEEGSSDFGNGLEGIAEDGDPSSQIDVLDANTGYVSPFAPGVFAVHEAGVSALFVSNSADLGEGLEALAEDGDPSGLADVLAAKTGVLSSGAFDTPVGASAPGVILPDGSYEFSFTAEEGAYLNFATMLVQTNDLFYSFGETGIELFPGGSALSGDITSSLSLWDSGTEVNEFPGAGVYQAPRQPSANSGDEENGNVRIVDDSFTYPATSSAIRVTITPQS